MSPTRVPEQYGIYSGRILILAAALFYVKFKLKKFGNDDFFQLLAGSWRLLFSIKILNVKTYSKIVFPAFGKILVLGAALFY